MTCKHVPSAKKIISELLHSTKYSHWSNCLQASSIGAILVGAVLCRIKNQECLQLQPQDQAILNDCHPAAGDQAVRDIFQTAAFFSEEKRVGPLVQELDSQTRRAFIRGQLSGLGYGLCQFHVFSSPMNL
ncbi:unnamed protein product [Sphagnum troendelagicum]